MENFLDKIAYISRIKLPENEKSSMEEQINELINYAEIIINHSNNSSSNQNKKEFFDQKDFNVFRQDIQKESFSENKIIENAPKSFENFFMVPDLIKRK